MIRRPQRRAPHRGRLSLPLFWLACLSLLVAGAMPGCGGCTSDDAQQTAEQKKKDDEAKKKKKKEKPKEDFEATSLRVQPYDSAGGLNRVKPGHWTAAHVAMKANNFHFNAELETATVDSRSQPLSIEHTPFRMVVSRPAALPKGQIKDFEATYYVPRRISGDTRGVWLQCRLRSAGSGREVAQALRMQPTTRMSDYQYYFVVLAANPDRYGYVKHLDSVEPPRPEFSTEPQIKYYEVVLPRTDGRSRLPLPAHPLAWSSIAYLLWDDLDPGRLGPDQQRSLLDWLQWGGQLIVSGPGSLEKLRGSFLAPYLPGEYVQSRDLDAAAFAALNQHWSRPGGVKPEDWQYLALRVEDMKPLLGVEWRPHPASFEMPGSGGLAIERRVGRGRIVMTAFPLSARNVINWNSYDTFFNSCLLRRPPRKFAKVDEYVEFEPHVLFSVGEAEGYEFDSRLSTMLRYFSRDVGPLGDSEPTGQEAYLISDATTDFTSDDLIVPAPYFDQPVRRRPQPPMNPDVADPHFGGYLPVNQSGMAGWNDYNGCASAARQALREAAGITIPKSDFVMRVLGVYLLVLVPINWALFRVIGRVEWAWIAAPLIAIAGAVGVIRFAQLDIGFARARTEVAVLEAQGDYPRAHVTRYTALYTSLSTSYDMSLSDESSLAQPFAVNPTGDPRLERATATVSFRHDAENVLSGFQVASNSTGMLHAEQMFNLGGAIRLTGDEQSGWKVDNGSDLSLRDVAVLRRTVGGDAQVAWIGSLDKQTTAGLSFAAAAENLRPAEWSKSEITSPPEDPDSAEVSLWQLFELATKQLRLNPGDVRLLGWTDTPLRGVEFRPAASQLTARTMVLVHLRHADLPQPKVDTVNKWSVNPLNKSQRFDDPENETEAPDNANGASNEAK